MINNFNRFVVANLDLLLNGLFVTFYVCILAFFLAAVLGLISCLLRLYVPIARYPAIGYIEFCRATPIFVQLLWVNYVWPGLFGFPNSVIGAGIIALGLQSSGYLAETFRSGIEGLSKGQTEAALSLGMSQSTILRRIVFPQVALVMSPSLANQIAVIIKSSTLVAVIGIPDLMYQTLRIVNLWFEPVEILTSVALVYFALIFLISLSANHLASTFRRKMGLVTV